MLKRFTSSLVALVMLIALLPVSTLAQDYSDVGSHWASGSIERWSEQGILQGYAGKFRPNSAITRGEMAVILERLSKYQTQATNTFNDLPQDYFYTKAILGANKAGIIKGDGATVRPEDDITREEASVMLGRVFEISDANASNTFADKNEISAWAKDYVNGAVARGIISGRPGGIFDPQNSITRAEVVTIIDNAIKAMYQEEGTQTDDVEGIALVNTAGVVLEDMKIDGDLIIAEGVGTGEVTLDSVTVTGRTIIRGGGTNSIIIKGNSSIGTVVVESKDNGVSVKVQDGANVEVIFVDDGSNEVFVHGDIGTLDIGANNSVSVVSGTVANVNVAGEQTKVTVAKDAKVSNLTASVATEIKNNGTVEKLNAKADGVVVDGSKPKEVTVDSNVTTPPSDSSGKEVTGSGNNTGGGGGDTTTSISITGVSVINATTVEVTLSGAKAGLTSADFTAATDDTETGTYATANTVSNAVAVSGNVKYTLTLGTGITANHFVKITATGSNLSASSATSKYVKVTSITVSGAGGATTITTNAGMLQMSAAILQEEASNKTVTWSINTKNNTSGANETGDATISETGLLTALNDGTVTVTATANDGSEVTGTKVITISGQTTAAIALDGVAYNVLEGKITGTTTNMQYQLDGGSWIDCGDSNTTGITFVAGTVKVRQKDKTANERQLGTISAAASAPINLSVNKSTPGTSAIMKAQTRVMAVDGMESSIDSGANWVPITDSSTVDLSGADVIVRVKATATALASAATAALPEYVDLSGVGVNVAEGNITGTATTMQYSLNSANGTDGTWADCSSTSTAVTFVEGNVYVRAKATPGNFKNVATVAKGTTPTTGHGVTYSVVGKTVGNLGAHEYSINGGAWSTGGTDVSFVAGDFKIRLKATASALPSDAYTVGTIAAPASAPTAPTITATGAALNKTKITAASEVEYAIVTSAGDASTDCTSVAGECQQVWTDGTEGGADTTVDVVAGYKILYRTKATSAALASNVGVLAITANDIAAVILASGSAGTVGNGKITELDSGKFYKVLVGATGSVTKYVQAGGTLGNSLENIGKLEGAEITGLVNGQTYKVIAADNYTQENNDPVMVRNYKNDNSAENAASVSVNGGKITLPVNPHGTGYIIGIGLKLGTKLGTPDASNKFKAVRINTENTAPVYAYQLQTYSPPSSHIWIPYVGTGTKTNADADGAGLGAYDWQSSGSLAGTTELYVAGDAHTRYYVIEGNDNTFTVLEVQVGS